MLPVRLAGPIMARTALLVNVVFSLRGMCNFPFCPGQLGRCTYLLEALYIFLLSRDSFATSCAVNLEQIPNTSMQTPPLLPFSTSGPIQFGLSQPKLGTAQYSI
jgi:hypothetical protein